MGSLLAVSPSGFTGGAERSIVRLAGWARDDGWDVAIAGPTGAFAELVRSTGGLRWVEIPDLRLPPAPRVVGVPLAATRWLEAGRRLRRAVAALDVDLVLANGLYALAAIGRAHLRRPVVHLVRDVLTQRGWPLFLRLGPAVAMTIAQSDAAARPLRARGLDVRIVRHGTPWPVEPARPAARPPAVVGVAAALTPWKGQDVLLDAVGGLPRDDVVVELAGGTYHQDHVFAQALHDRAQRADLVGRVRFLGHEAGVVERMRSWSVATSPSVQPESGGLALLEAMSLGVPAVATEHGGPAEVLGDAGLLVPPGDAGALGTAIARLLDDRALYERCSRAGRQQIAARYTLDHQRRGLLALLDEFVGP